MLYNGIAFLKERGLEGTAIAEEVTKLRIFVASSGYILFLITV